MKNLIFSILYRCKKKIGDTIHATFHRSVASEASFTLVEILIVIGVIAILTAITLVILNPVEYIKRGRDDQRMGDINSLQTLITQKEYSGNRISFGQSNVVYISLADSSSTCGSYALPSLASGWSYHCAPTASYRNVDGTGWLPVDISASKTFAVLPIDPISDQNYYYAFIANSDNSFVLTSMFESQQELQNIAAKDNGTDDTRYETGTNVALWTQASGLVGYWKFDEGSGSTTADSSGNGNTGIWQGTLGSQWTTGYGQAYAGNFNGASYVIASPINLPRFTISSWIKPSGNQVGTPSIIADMYPSYVNYTITFDPGTTNIFAGFYNAGWYQTSRTTVSANVWSYVLATYDGSSIKLYVNGALVGSMAAAITPMSSGTQLRIGRRWDLADYINGSIEGVRIYNRALTATEIQNLYTAEK